MSEATGNLVPSADGLAIRTFLNVAEVAAGLDPSVSYWGFYTTPAEARLLCAPAVRWQEIAGQEHLQELRVFGQDRDLHWQDGRGVALSVVPAGTAAVATIAGGPGWWQRNRRSRLWGQWLEGTDTWYEERIPDPLRYEGLAGCAANLFAFLVYREYVEAGCVRYLRCVDVEGGTR